MYKTLRSCGLFLEFYPSSSGKNSIFEKHDQVAKRKKGDNRQTDHNRVIDLEMRISEEFLGISFVIIGHPIDQSCKSQGYDESQDKVVKYFPQRVSFFNCVCSDDLLADRTIVLFDKAILLRDNFIDEAIFVYVLETTLAGACGVDERIIKLISLFQANPALLLGAYSLWIVWHYSYIDDSSISLSVKLSLDSYSKCEPFGILKNGRGLALAPLRRKMKFVAVLIKMQKTTRNYSYQVNQDFFHKMEARNQQQSQHFSNNHQITFCKKTEICYLFQWITYKQWGQGFQQVS